MLNTSVFSVSKNWLKDYNRSSRHADVSEQEVRDKLLQATAGFDKIFAKEFAKGNVPVATAPAPDVLELSFYVLNIRVAAPDTSAGYVRSFPLMRGRLRLPWKRVIR